MKCEIEKGIPIPEKTIGQGAGPQYPFKDMAVGDSFIAPHSKCQSLKASASQRGRFHGGKFITRILPNGIRCWRIA